MYLNGFPNPHVQKLRENPWILLQELLLDLNFEKNNPIYENNTRLYALKTGRPARWRI